MRRFVAFSASACATGVFTHTNCASNLKQRIEELNGRLAILEAGSKTPSIDPSDVVLMMNGLPGAMGHEVSAACLRRGFQIAPIALTGPGAPSHVNVSDGEGGPTTAVRLVAGDDAVGRLEAAAELKAKYGDSLVCVDFTHPSAVNMNAQFYADNGFAFVMGTTGGDREHLRKVTEDAGNYAIIAANMCKQIVAFQATFESMANSFPGAFSGYKMDLTESHQSTKADTSGTAKDMVQHFNGLGLDFHVDDITKIRTADAQADFGVPSSALRGHAFHTYTLTSEDGSVEFQFKHNVAGRRTYAEGVADAVAFLAAQRKAESDKKVFNMIDVLAAGKMQ
jgi:4-hydroxy-tetrahydrodipicolinate reductase